MKEIVSFSKEIEFKTMISKITSISLDHTLDVDNNNINGDFLVAGTYRMTSASQIDEEFSYKIPVDIEIDEKYITTDLIFDINDFTYEVLNEEILLVKIDLCLDNLEEKIIEAINIEDEEIETIDFNEDEEQEENREEMFNNDIRVDEIVVIDEYDKRNEELENLFKQIEVEQKLEIPVEEKEEDIETFKFDPTGNDSIFMNFNNDAESYKAYHIHIVRDGDNIDSILTKYKTTKESLEEYNNINEIRVGTKIIVPAIKDEE